jgi:hypothetical protein
MARTYDAIDEHWRTWIAAQPMFFVGTAPLAGEGHVNVSPKGPIGTLRVLGPRRVAYLDYAGSGAETVAHVRENGRVVVMFCAFEGPPRIVRLHGRGRAVLAGTPAFDALISQAGFEEVTIPEARRAVVDVEVTRVAQSCGYGVPLMTLTGEREHYDRYKRKRLRVMGRDGLLRHQGAQNAHSLDGLPALAMDDAGAHPATASASSGAGAAGNDRTQAHTMREDQ